MGKGAVRAVGCLCVCTIAIGSWIVRVSTRLQPATQRTANWEQQLRGRTVLASRMKEITSGLDKHRRYFG